MSDRAGSPEVTFEPRRETEKKKLSKDLSEGCSWERKQQGV